MNEKNAIAPTKKKKIKTERQARVIRETANAILATNTNEQASEILGISISAFFRRKSAYPDIQGLIDREMKTIKENAIKHIKLNTMSYVNEIEEIAKLSNSDKVRLEANLEMLDRAGIQKPLQTTANIQVNVLNAMRKQQSDYDL